MMRIAHISSVLLCFCVFVATAVAQSESLNELGVHPAWPENGKELLNALRERDREFDRRIVELEQRWTERISPSAQIASIRFNARKFGQPDPGSPAKEEIPDDYEQAHRVHYQVIANGDEFTLKRVGERAEILHPEYTALNNSGFIWSTVGGIERSYSPETKTLHVTGAPNGSGILSSYRWQFAWGCGYGAARYIRTIESINKKVDQLVVTGRSELFTGDDSRFELVLDKDLVLRSIMIKVPSRPNGFNVYFAGTVGTHTSEGHPPMAKQGHYQRILQPEGKPERVYEEFDVVFLKASEILPDEAYEFETQIEPAEGTNTVDLRPRNK